MADQKKAPAYQGGEIFLLKMGEIVLKGLNRRKFEDRLTANISRRIHKYGRFPHLCPAVHGVCGAAGGLLRSGAGLGGHSAGVWRGGPEPCQGLREGQGCLL